MVKAVVAASSSFDLDYPLHLHLGFEPTAFDPQTSSPLNTTDASWPLPVELYLVSAILACMTIVGTAGNAVVVYVFSRKRDKLVSTFFILTLAFVDFVTCLVVIPYTVYMEVVEFQTDLDIVCKFYQFLITSNIPFSALIMVAIAIDRYFCICHPFKRAMTVARARVVVVAMATLAGAIGLCVSLMYGVYDYRVVGGPTEDAATSSSSSPDGSNQNDAGPCDVSRSMACRHLPEAEVGCCNEPEEHVKPEAVVGGSATEAAASASTDGLETVEYVLENTGQCITNEVIISPNFRMAFQKLYTALYLLCFVTVVVLYILIYRSVLDRRARRQTQRSAHLPLVAATTTSAAASRKPTFAKARTPNTSLPTPERTLFTTADLPSGDAEDLDSPARGNGEHWQKESTPRTPQKAAARMANLKTAGVLFVVTLVFIVTFLPAFLMALQLIPYNMTIFYMYFANNVANPVIYSFMNRNFRDKMKRLLCRH